MADLFKYVSNSDYKHTAPNNGMTVNNEFKMEWRVAVVAYFQVISWCLPARIEEISQDFSVDSLSHIRDSKFDALLFNCLAFWL